MSNILKIVRVSKGYTQKDVAEGCGLTTRTYGRRENSPGTFTVDEINAIAKFLDVDVGIFFEKEVTLKVN